MAQGFGTGFLQGFQVGTKQAADEENRKIAREKIEADRGALAFNQAVKLEELAIKTREANIENSGNRLMSGLSFEFSPISQDLQRYQNYSGNPKDFTWSPDVAQDLQNIGALNLNYSPSGGKTYKSVFEKFVSGAPLDANDLKQADEIFAPYLQVASDEDYGDGRKIVQKNIHSIDINEDGSFILNLKVTLDDGGTYMAPLTQNRTSDPDDQVAMGDPSAAADRIKMAIDLQELSEQDPQVKEYFEGNKEFVQKANTGELRSRMIDSVSPISGISDPRTSLEKKLAGAGIYKGTPEYNQAVREETDAAFKGEREGYGKTLAADYDDVVEKARAARTTLTNYTTAARLGVKGTGSFAKARQAASVMFATAFEDYPELIPEFEEILDGATDWNNFNALMMQEGLNIFATQKGPQTEGDATRILSTIPSIQSLEGSNDFLLAYFSAVAERKIDKRDFYQAYRKENGSIEGADMAWDNYVENVPLIAVDENAPNGYLYFNQFRKELRSVYKDKVGKGKEYADKEALDDAITDLWIQDYGFDNPRVPQPNPYD